MIGRRNRSIQAVSWTARGLARREAEKLALYCLGAERVSIEDVEAICGNDTGSTPDELADSVFGGDSGGDRDAHADGCRSAGGSDGRVARLEVHLFEDLAERHGQRFVDDDAERTFVGGVFADQRD